MTGQAGNEHGTLFDARAIRDFAAEMQASTGDDLGPMIWRDVQRLAESQMRLEAVLYPPDSPPRDDASGEGGDATVLAGSPSVPTDVPHLDRACELLWQAGHPAIAQALEREVERLIVTYRVGAIAE